MHRQALNKFDTIEQGQKAVQELIQEFTKYSARMVQYLDDYLFRRWLIAALWPSLQKEVLHRGITVEFSSMQDILEKAKDIEDSSCYDIRSWMPVKTTHSSAYANQSMAKSSKWMIEVAPKGTTGQIRTNRQDAQPTVTPKTLSILTPNAVWEVHCLTAWEFHLALGSYT